MTSINKKIKAMMPKYFSFLLFFLYGALYAQGTDTKGTDFWLTFGQNGRFAHTEVQMEIRIVGGDEDAKVTVYYTALDSTVSFSVTANSVYTYRILGDKLKQAVYARTAGISKKSIHLTTTAPVSVYALNQRIGTTDATNILPVTALGTKYYNISYIQTPSEKAACLMVATQNDTRIVYRDLPPVTLKRGEVYYYTETADMTGAHITADKPIAYFSATQSALIPKGQRMADHLFQQLAPVNTWGKTFFVPVSCKKRDRIRIMASQNGTDIVQTGGVLITDVQGGETTLTGLNAGQWVEMEVLLDSSGCFIQTNKPVGVCTYLTGIEYTFPGADTKISDPAQAWLPPIEQTVKTALLAPFIPKGTTELTKHDAILITPWATRNETRVKRGSGTETILSGGQWYRSPVGDMAFYDYLLTSKDEAYTFTNPEGVIVMGYGMGEAESYYYLASSSMRTLDVAFYVNDVYYKELYSTFFCTQPTLFLADIKGDMSKDPEHLKWYINDTLQTAATDLLTWSKTLADGVYRIKIEVLMDDGETVRVEESDLTIAHPELDQPTDITLCPGETTPTVSGTGTLLHEKSSVWEVISGDGTRIGLKTNSGTLPIPAFKAVNTGNRSDTVKIQITPVAANGCAGEPKTFTITVKAKANLTIDFGKDTVICRMDSILLNATHPLADSYQWHDNSTNATYTVYHKAGIFWVILTGQCNEFRDSINITHYKELTASLGKDLLFCEEDVIYREIKVNVNMSNVTYRWQDGLTTTPTYVVTQQGIYSVTVSNLCMSVSDAIEVKLKDCRQLEMWIPNAFTPNDDGVNDIFKPEINHLAYLKEYEMKIYDRWGALIFATQESQTGWNGKDRKNKDCPQGIYTVMIKYKNNEGVDFVRQCSVTLVR